MPNQSKIAVHNVEYEIGMWISKCNNSIVFCHVIWFRCVEWKWSCTAQTIELVGIFYNWQVLLFELNMT